MFLPYFTHSLSTTYLCTPQQNSTLHPIKNQQIKSPYQNTSRIALIMHYRPVTKGDHKKGAAPTVTPSQNQRLWLSKITTKKRILKSSAQQTNFYTLTTIAQLNYLLPKYTSTPPKTKIFSPDLEKTTCCPFIDNVGQKTQPTTFVKVRHVQAKRSPLC